MRKNVRGDVSKADNSIQCRLSGESPFVCRYNEEVRPVAHLDHLLVISLGLAGQLPLFYRKLVKYTRTASCRVVRSNSVCKLKFILTAARNAARRSPYINWEDFLVCREK
ncbi:hypothetical protein J6590_017039 [Homalodisca vitripennis]|nr:hypothetical protein J6590_017039 [Homalodisca vitripennis]